MIVFVVFLTFPFPYSAQVKKEDLTSDFTPPQGAAHGFDREGEGAWQKRLMTAVSEDGLNFRRTNGVITDQGNVPDFVPGDEGVLYLYYSAGVAGERNNAMAVAITFDAGETWIFKYVVIHGTERMGSPGDPDVCRLPDGRFRMYFTSGAPGAKAPQIFYAEGEDGIQFELKGPAFGMEDEPVIDSFTTLIGETWHMYTLGSSANRLWHAVSMDGTVFQYAGHPEFRVEGRTYIPTNELVLEDGRVRFFAFGPGRGGDIRSFITKDGYEWEPEEGARLSLDESGGLEKDFVKDAAVVKLEDGKYLMVYVTGIPE